MKNKWWIICSFFYISAASIDIKGQCIGTLVWQDEFNGSSLDMTKWSYDIGNGCPSLCGWGNNELEYYTNSTNNVRVAGGNLVLEARLQAMGGSPFTSGKIISRNKAFWTYGRFEARMRMPEGRGLWPAFWMLPEVNTWPTTGELDIMEYRGDYNNRTSATLHYGNPWPNNLWDGSDHYHTSSLASAYHIYAAEWTATEIRWYFDDILIKIETRTPNTLNPANNNANVWPWTTNFHFILNLAVGGWFPGVTNAADVVLTKPTFEIDYVRVYDMTTAVGTQWPYNGTPAAIPGMIQAEEYDRGCDQAAYFDSDLPNNGGQMRGERVDIEACADIGGGYNVGWTNANEWLEYTVNAAATGTYNLTFRIASTSTTGRLRVEIDGTDITGSINIPNTGGWTNWQNVTINNRPISVGNHIMRVYIENGGFNFNHVTIATNTILPVTLLDFYGLKQNNQFVLNWSTATETNSSHYDIQSSPDGVTWYTLGSLPAEGNSSSIKNYSYITSLPLQKTYYRIRQYDLDGLYFLSEIIYAEPDIVLSIHPNPFSEETYLESTRTPQTMYVYDLAGKLMQIITVEEKDKVAFGRDLTRGIYLIKTDTGNMFKVIKE